MFREAGKSGQFIGFKLATLTLLLLSSGAIAACQQPERELESPEPEQESPATESDPKYEKEGVDTQEDDDPE